MALTRGDVQNWLAGELATRLAAAFEGMTGERPAVESKTAPAAPKDSSLRWRQPFSNVSGAMWILASEAAWREGGAQVLNAAGIDDADAAQLRSECLEVIGQALAGAGMAIGARVGTEVTPKGGQESEALPADLQWMLLQARFSGSAAEFFAGFEPALLDAFLGGGAPGAEEKQIEPPAPKSKTFDLLLDVELPVSVSFGRAQVALKDCLKLTTGSIVELNRAIGDPVEVIVNNCVIARGEVVVVEGNFGVRIQQVISRQERLRTLN